MIRKTTSVTIRPDDFIFIQEHGYSLSQALDLGIKIIRDDVAEIENGKKFDREFPKIRQKVEEYIKTFEFPPLPKDAAMPVGKNPVDQSLLPLEETMEYKGVLFRDCCFVTRKYIRYSGFKDLDELFNIFCWHFKDLFKRFKIQRLEVEQKK